MMIFRAQGREGSDSIFAAPQLFDLDPKKPEVRRPVSALALGDARKGEILS